MLIEGAQGIAVLKLPFADIHCLSYWIYLKNPKSIFAFF